MFRKTNKNYLGIKKYFALADHGTFIGQPAYLFYLAPASYFRVKKNSFMTFTVYIFFPTVIFFSYLVVFFHTVPLENFLKGSA